MGQWEIGLDSYMIKDTLSEFYTGQIVEFALEAQSEDEKAVTGQSLKTFKHIKLGLYDFDAEIIYLKDGLGVFDFGIRASTRFDTDTPIGTKIQGHTHLFVDWEYWSLKNSYPNLPPMVYTWRIESINIQTGPYIVTYNSVGGKSISRDETKIGYRPVERTNAWEDDDGNAFYFLNCTLLDINPKE